MVVSSITTVTILSAPPVVPVAVAALVEDPEGDEKVPEPAEPVEVPDEDPDPGALDTKVENVEPPVAVEFE